MSPVGGVSINLAIQDQWLQVMVQRRIIARVLSETKPLKPPLAARLLARFPFLRRIPARVVALGIRPEHVDPNIVHFGSGYEILGRYLLGWTTRSKSNRVNDKNVKGFLTGAPSTCGRYFVSAVLLR